MSGTHRVIYADSSDGITWSNHQLSQDVDTGAVISDADDVGVKNPTVVKDGTEFKMWYEGEDFNGFSRIVYAASLDGLDWRAHTIAVDKGSAGVYGSYGFSSPMVVKDGDTYHMWYTALGVDRNIVLYGQSAGGVIWSAFTPLPVLVGADEGFYDYVSALKPSLILNRDTVASNVLLKTKLKIYD